MHICPVDNPQLGIAEIMPCDVRENGEYFHGPITAANAAFIVLACNFHRPLLESLEKLILCVSATKYHEEVAFVSNTLRAIIAAQEAEK